MFYSGKDIFLIEGWKVYVVDQKKVFGFQELKINSVNVWMLIKKLNIN